MPTSAHWEAANLPQISVKTVRSAGPIWASAPTALFLLPLHPRSAEHRLELLDGGAGISIIDDAFNANPVGAQCALRVIAGFPGRRIIITPGMVELGGKEDEFNRTFGKQMADSVDIAILVGRKHTQPIVEGLKEAGFPQENTYVVGSLEESTTLLHSMMRAGDVVLYENDLPDNYSE